MSTYRLQGDELTIIDWGIPRHRIIPQTSIRVAIRVLIDPFSWWLQLMSLGFGEKQKSLGPADSTGIWRKDRTEGGRCFSTE